LLLPTGKSQHWQKQDVLYDEAINSACSTKTVLMPKNDTLGSSILRQYQTVKEVRLLYDGILFHLLQPQLQK